MEFKKYKLKDLVKEKTQGVNTTTDEIKYVSSGIKIIQAKNIKKYEYDFDKENYITLETYNQMKDNHKLKNGDTLFTNIGSQLGNCAIFDSNEKCIITWNVLKLVPNKLVNNYYLCYYLNYKSDFIRTLNSSSTMPFVSGKTITNIDCRIPNVEYQNKVVTILNSLNNKIKVNNQINNNLLKITNEYFENEIFYKNNSNLKDYKLKDIATITNGYSYKGSELVKNSNIGMATIKNFERKGGFKLDGFKPISTNKPKENQYAEKNDILVACTDLTQNAEIIGNAILLLNLKNFEKIVISMDLVKVQSIKGNLINDYFLYGILNSKEFKNFALGYKSGTTVLHLDKKCFEDFEIKLPNVEKIKEISKIIEINYKKISKIIEENLVLEQLRDTLLPKLMNGEIDLDKIEI